MKKATILFIISLIFLGGLGIYQYSLFYDGKLHIIFCDVGQGDAIVIRTPEQKTIIVDSGPNDKIISCLQKNMPFWDRAIHLAVLTHPHQDHMAGFAKVLSTFNVEAFATEKLRNDTFAHRKLFRILENQKIPVQYLYAGDKVRLGSGLRFTVVGPTKQYLQTSSPFGSIGESGEFANIVLLLEYGKTKVLLTGDSQSIGLDQAVRRFGIIDIDVLQVPHHGSKTGLTKELLDQLSPDIAVISVGKNRYGHPSPTTIGLLKNSGAKVLTTLQSGDLEMVSDGTRFKVR